MRLLFILLVSWLATLAYADSSTVCLEEAEFNTELLAENAVLAEKVSALRSVYRGESISLAELQLLLGDKLASAEQLKQRRLQFKEDEGRPIVFESPLCNAYAAELVQNQQINIRLSGEYQRLMQRFLAMDDANLLSLIALQKNQLTLNKTLEYFLQNQHLSPEVKEQASRYGQDLSEQIDKLFVAFLFLEPPSLQTLTRHSELMSLNLELTPTDQDNAQEVMQLQNIFYRTRIALTHSRTELHHLVWLTIPSVQLLLPSSLIELPDFGLREAKLFIWHVQQSWLETQLNMAESDSFWARSPWLLLLSSVVSGLLFFAALLYLAKQSERMVYWLHEQVIDEIKQRWLVRLANGVSRVGALLPWLILWFSLSWLADIFTYYHYYAWLWALPFLQIIILYGLVSLLLEWLLFKVANNAGSFLNAEQAEALQKLIKRASYFIVVPWAAVLLIDKVIGASLLYRVTFLVAILVLYWQLASLLKERRHDFVRNTEQALARELSPELQQKLKGPLFILWAPILLPIQLSYFALLALSSVLQDFDWFRRLSARWFWLRTRYQLEQQEENQNAQIHADYRRWFLGDEVDGKALPVIDTGLANAISKPIEAWMADRVNENTLVVTGEKGIGKSVVLNQVEKLLVEQFKDEPLRIIRHKIQHKLIREVQLRALMTELLDIDINHGTEQLAALDASLTPTVIILDECQNLFLSQIGGLDAWKTLVDITNTRLENIFWVFVINDQSWAYLGNVFGRQYQVRNVIRAKRWSQNDIRSLILSRTHLSGYRVSYDEVLLSSYGPQQNTGRSAEQRFFSLLWDSCKGIPMIALAMWLTAIETRGKEVQVGLPVLADSKELTELGDDLLFVYRAIMTHENLSVTELQAVTRQPENLIRYALKIGTDIGFLYSDTGRKYRISTLWQHSLATFLARKNMNHE